MTLWKHFVEALSEVGRSVRRYPLFAAFWVVVAALSAGGWYLLFVFAERVVPLLAVGLLLIVVRHLDAKVDRLEQQVRDLYMHGAGEQRKAQVPTPGQFPPEPCDTCGRPATHFARDVFRDYGSGRTVKLSASTIVKKGCDEHPVSSETHWGLGLFPSASR